MGKLILGEQTTTDAPATGFHLIYPKSDSNLYFKSSNDVEYIIPKYTNIIHTSHDWVLIGQINTGSQASTNVNITGCKIGDFVDCSCTSTLSGLRLWGEVISDDQITLFLSNNTGGSISPANLIINIKIISV